MNKFMLLAGLFLVGCSTTKEKVVPLGKVRTTYYCAAEDKKWGNKIAMHSKMRAVEGVTVAVDPRVISYGSWVKIPELKEDVGSCYFLASDTGAAVKKRLASRGKTIILDIYVNSRRKMNELAMNNEKYLDAYLLE